MRDVAKRSPVIENVVRQTIFKLVISVMQLLHLLSNHDSINIPQSYAYSIMTWIYQ